jgi:hypothetical protein
VIAFSDMKTINQDGTSELSAYTTLEGLKDPVLRARAVMSRAGDWWTPNRGVLRTDAARSTGGLQRHLAGEFSADLPWILHMALLGEFVREPEVLCVKNYKPSSVSRAWRFTRGDYAALALSCAREVARARVPLRLKLAVLRFVVPQCLRMVKPWLLRRGSAGWTPDR